MSEAMWIMAYVCGYLTIGATLAWVFEFMNGKNLSVDVNKDSNFLVAMMIGWPFVMIALAVAVIATIIAGATFLTMNFIFSSTTRKTR